MGSDLYLGFGPLLYSKENKRTELKQKAINAEEKNSLTLIYPKQNEETFKQIMQLIHWFGTLGGRSRNGWGSIAVKTIDLISVGATPSSRLNGTQLQDYSILLNGKADLTAVQKPLKSCLIEEWPHAIGEDEKGVLIWKTESCKTWMQVMRKLAEIKIGFRAKTLPFKQNKDKANPVLDERHILSYPVTHHGVSGWAELDRHGNLKIDRQGYLIQKYRIAIDLLKRSGGALKLTCPWFSNPDNPESLLDSPMGQLIRLKDALAKSDMSRRAAYIAQDWLRQLPPQSLFESDPQQYQSMLQQSLQDPLRRQNQGIEQYHDLAKSLAELGINLKGQNCIDFISHFIGIAEFLARDSRAGGA